ncbi:MAG: DJ-1/PfpI family protein [Calditrichia bacterium]
MGNLDNKQILLIVGQKNYSEEELEYLRAELEKEGAEVWVASNSPEKALGRLDGYVTPDLTIGDANPEEYDVIILTGGAGGRVYLWDDPDTQELVRRAHSAGKLIAAISTAPVVLANAGILEGKRATVYPDYDSAETLIARGAKTVQQSVVVDDNIITCNHPRHLSKFKEAIVSKLQE